MKTQFRPLVCLLLLSLSLEVLASRVFHKSLEEVLSLGTPVVKARVDSAKVEILPGQLVVTVEYSQGQVVRGVAPTQGVVSHSFSTMIERRQSDGTVLRVSPIREGSGLEQNLEPGKVYYLIMDASATQLLRVESLDQAERFRILPSRL